MSKFNEICWKIHTLSSKFYDKFNPKCNDFLGAIQISQVQFEFTKLQLMATALEAYISFIQYLFLIKFIGLYFSRSFVIAVKFSCKSKLFWIFGSNSKFKN